MKIGILTQPLISNYGGLIQAYALKETLLSLGHEVVIVNRLHWGYSRIRVLASKLKNNVLRSIKSEKIFFTGSQTKMILSETTSFRNKYLSELSESITVNIGMKKLSKMGFSAYVVGSDQCWRPCYSPCIRNYFLDFAKDVNDIRKISYAASFGVSDWEFNRYDTDICRKLIQKFDAISVREDSAIELVRKYFGRDDAIHLLDPTMLLPKEKYLEITTNENVFMSPGQLKVYILDKTEGKKEILKYIIETLGYKPFEIYPQKRKGIDEVSDLNLEDFKYPHPAKWLRGFEDAKFVVTDSFHGVVFSILFNVPFVAIGNKSRGMARFESLLRLFELEDRLITCFSKDNLYEIIHKRINWENINSKLKSEQKKAFDFLTKQLQ